MTKNTWVVCVNDENFFHPEFELTEGKAYLVYDVKIKPSLLTKGVLKLVFQTPTGTFVEINARRFRRLN